MDKQIESKISKIFISYIQQDGSKDMELIIPYNQEIVIKDGKYILRNKKFEYPSTFEECRKILNIDKTFIIENYNMVFWNHKLLESLQKLMICHRAYCKIAGDNLGLDEPWKPNWDNEEEYKYGIYGFRNSVIKDNSCLNTTMLCFPKEEIRDLFFNNFRSLIEECKEII